jgi:enamine deaminase RidA (YjgF/YER057c/UK114 family)
VPLSSYYTIEREDIMTGKIVFIAVLFTVVAAAAFGQSDSTSRRTINLPRAVPNLPFSDGVLVGNTLYLSGRSGVDPQSGKVPTDVNDEMGNLLGGLKKMLELAHMTMDDLVFVQVFCPDLSLYGRFNFAYRTYFARDFPARAFLGSGPLLFGAHFEIQGIAVK